MKWKWTKRLGSCQKGYTCHRCRWFGSCIWCKGKKSYTRKHRIKYL